MAFWCGGVGFVQRCMGGRFCALWGGFVWGGGVRFVGDRAPSFVPRVGAGLVLHCTKALLRRNDELFSQGVDGFARID